MVLSVPRFGMPGKTQVTFNILFQLWPYLAYQFCGQLRLNRVHFGSTIWFSTIHSFYQHFTANPQYLVLTKD